MKTIRFKAVGPREHPKLRPTREELSRIHLGPSTYKLGGPAYKVLCSASGAGKHVLGYVQKFKGKWTRKALIYGIVTERWLAFAVTGKRVTYIAPQLTRRDAGEALQ